MSSALQAVEVRGAVAPRDAQIDRTQPIAPQIYAVLRQRIVDNRLEPGEQISEAALAKTFEISRTPLRAALRAVPLRDLLAAFEPETAEELRDVVLRAVERDAERRSDLRVGEPLGDQSSHLELATRDFLDACPQAFGHLVRSHYPPSDDSHRWAGSLRRHYPMTAERPAAADGSG